MNGNLTLTNAQSILDVNSAYNIPVTINGNFTNNGSYNHYNNLTTFAGGSQLLLGTMPATPTDFYDLNVSPVTKLTLSKDITVTHNLSIGNGTLECINLSRKCKGKCCKQWNLYKLEFHKWIDIKWNHSATSVRNRNLWTDRVR